MRRLLLAGLALLWAQPAARAQKTLAPALPPSFHLGLPPAAAPLGTAAPGVPAAPPALTGETLPAALPSLAAALPGLEPTVPPAQAPLIPRVPAAAPEENPDGAQASGDRLFDGRAGGRPAPPVPVDDGLRELSQAWQTQAQLKRLAEAPRAPAEPFEFAVIGDAEPGRFWFSRILFNRPGVFERQLRRISGLPVDFVVQLGDMVSRGTPRNFLRFLRGLASSGLKAAYLTVIGNHDRRKPHGESDSRVYRAVFGPTDYHFDRGGYRFVVLDTSAGRLRPAQLEWLRRTLDTSLRKIVFTHMPPAVLRAFRAYDPAALGAFKVGAREFARLAADNGVERVYMGHIHAFGATDYLGVRYILTGGGGSPLFPSGVRNRFHHFLRVRAGPDGVTERVYKDRRAGKDEGTILTVEEASRPARSARRPASRRRLFPGRGPRRTRRRSPD